MQSLPIKLLALASCLRTLCHNEDDWLRPASLFNLAIGLALTELATGGLPTPSSTIWWK